jgi:hypothetical protein
MAGSLPWREVLYHRFWSVSHDYEVNFNVRGIVAPIYAARQSHADPSP